MTPHLRDVRVEDAAWRSGQWRAAVDVGGGAEGETERRVNDKTKDS